MYRWTRGFGEKVIDHFPHAGSHFAPGVLIATALATIVRFIRAIRRVRAEAQQKRPVSSMTLAPLLMVMGLALLLAIVAIWIHPAQAAEPHLSFVDEGKMSVKHGPAEKTVSTSVLLRNDNESELQNLRFSARVQDSAGTVRDDALRINLANPQDANIEQLTVKRVPIQIEISGDPS